MIRMLLLPAFIFLIGTSLQAKKPDVKLNFPERFYLDGLFTIDEDETVVQVCDVQPGATYAIYLYDEREKEKRVCEYMYGQEFKGNDEFIKIQADETTCLKFDVERFDCKFESEVEVYLIMHCLDCQANEDIIRDPTINPTCDLKMREENDYRYLVEDILLAKTCFEVDIQSIEGRGTIGEFWQGDFTLGMTDGIAMANAPLGSYQSVGGGNGATNTGTSLGTAGDIDLSQLLGFATWDAAVLEFDFFPSDEFVEFQYVFASEEYCEWVNSPFNDGFALLLSGPNVNGFDVGQPSLNNNAVNLAVLPGTDGQLDFTTNVAIRTINWNHFLYGHIGQVGNFYVSNNFLVDDRTLQGPHNSIGTCAPTELRQSPPPAIPPAAPTECAFDAWTTVLTARFDDLIPCEKYHIKMVMADGTDRIWGSGIFLRGSSFSAGGAGASYDITFANGEKFVYENCGDQLATLVLTRLDNENTADLFVEYGFEISGTATKNFDYTTDLETTIIIPPLPPPGELFRFIEVIPDDIDEGVETIVITIDDPCNCDPQTIELEIVDIPPLTWLPLNNDTSCFATPQGFSANVEGGFPDVDRGFPVSGYEYQWSDEDGVVGTNRNYQFTPPNEPGTYTYFLEVSDECGQTIFDTASVTITGFPDAELVGTEFVCEQSPEAQLTVLLGGAGPWELVYAIDGVEQPSVITDDPNYTLPATEIGEYTLISVFSGGCSGPTEGLAIVSPSILAIDATSGETSCSDSADGELTGTASGGVGPLTYLWDNGETTETITDLEDGTYTLVVTDSLGCETMIEATITSPDAVTITAGLLNGTTCADPESGSAEATGDGGSGVYTYEWFSSGGAVVSSEQTPSDLIAGMYTVVAYDENGCPSEPAEVEVTSDLDTPNAEVDLPEQFTCLTDLITIDGSNSSSGGNIIYEWTTVDGNIISSDDGATIDVDMPGTYVLLVTNTDNGCTNPVTVEVLENVSDPLADAGLTQQLNCTVQMAQLGGTDISSGPEFTYEWTTTNGNIVSGGDTVNPDVDASGTYTLIVTNTENGCTAESTVDITEDIAEPEIVGANPADLTCVETSQIIDASGSSTGPDFIYTWTTSDGNILSGDDSLMPTIDDPGTYTLVITNSANNCSTEETFEVGQVADIPVVAIADPMIINCINTQITLDGSGSDSGADIVYTWTTPNGTIVSDGSTPNPTIDAAGTYTLTVSNSATGCEESTEVTVIEDMVPPTADAGQPQQIDCITTEINLGGPGTSAGPQFTYEWTTTNGQISTSPNISEPRTTTGGTYEVLVTNTENGCTATSIVTITEDAEDPMIVEIFPDVLTCERASQTLDVTGSSSGPNFTYQWTTATGNIVSGANSMTPVIDDPGTYELIVTNTDNGCTETAIYSIAEDADFPVAVIAEPIELNCLTQIVSLNGTGSDTGAGITYEWQTPDGNLLSTTSGTNADVDAPGTYILVVNNEETGCSETAQVEVIQNIEDPIADAGPEQQIDCENAMVNLGGTTISTGPEFTYEWSTNSGNIVNGDNSTNPTIDAGGTYQVIVTNTNNGCTAEATVLIAESTEDPTISPVFPEVLTCEAPDQILDATGSSAGPEFIYTWTTPDGNIVSGADGLSPTVDDPGTYTLLITNSSNNCSVEESFTVDEDADFPNVTIAPAIVLDCDNESIELDASGSDSGPDITYEWTTADGNIVRNGDSDLVEIDEPGTYTLTVSNAASGCDESEFIIVESNFEPPAVDAGPGAILSCTEETVMLDGSNSAQGSNITYEWTTSAGNIISSTDGQTAEVDQPGTYELIVTNTDNGCTDSREVVVEADENLPTVDVTEPEMLTCELQMTVLDASGSDQNSDLEYTWETSDGNIVSGIDGLTPTVDQPGIYTLTIVNTLNGCDASSSITVEQNIVEPIADAGITAELTCETLILNLDGDDSDLGSEFTYEWTTADGNILSGSNTLTPEIDSPGNYILTVINTENNCQATSMVEITEDIQEPNVMIENPALITCSASTISVDGSASDSGANFESTWTDVGGNTVGNSNTLDVVESGEYTLTVVNTQNGCETFMTIEVIEDIQDPDIIVAAPDVLTCADEEVMVSGLGSSEGDEFTYTWTTLNGTFVQETDQIEVGVTQPGIYELVVTNTTNDCTNTATIEVIQDIVDPIATSGQTLEITCAAPENNLDGTGSSAGADFSYEWIADNGGFVLNGNTTLNPLINAAGSYTLIVTDNTNGCTAESTVQVTSNDVFPLANIADPDELTCVVLETTLSASSDATGATYEWSTADGNILSGGDTQNPVIDAPGTYVVEITDPDNGCITPTSILVIEDVENPTVEAGDEFELNCTIDEVNLLGSASTGSNFDYLWTTPDGSILSGDNTLNPLVDEAGTYVLTVVNTENGCTSLDDVQVRLDPNVPTGFQAEVLPPLCFGQTASIVVTGVDGNSGPYSYSLDGGTTFSDENVFDNLPPGATYEVFILDQNGCDLTETFVVPAVDSLTVETTTPELEILIGDEATLNAVTNWPEDEIASILWTPSDGLSCDDCLNPTTSNTSSTVYTVTVVNENGCEDKAEVVLKVDRQIDIYIPNAFSPLNNDGVNDVFMIFARDGSVVNVESFQVYDRWGEKMFEDADFLPNDPEHGWTGIYKTEQMQPGVFVYYAIVTLIDGSELLLEGDVTLMH